MIGFQKDPASLGLLVC